MERLPGQPWTQRPLPDNNNRVLSPEEQRMKSVSFATKPWEKSTRLGMAVFVLLIVGLMAPESWVRADDAYVPTVFITGSNRGLGFEFASQYAAKGWRVIATARNLDKADDLKALAKAHDNFILEQLDVTDHARIDALAEQYKDQPIDILINNAALVNDPNRGQMIGSIDFDTFDTYFHINAMGPLKLSEAFWDHVKASEKKIIATLTTGAGIPAPGFLFYKASKATLDNFVDQLAEAGEKNGIKVVKLQPGFVDTHDLFDDARTPPFVTDIHQSIAGMINVMENLTPEQSGQTVRYDGTSPR
jgi:NAD(P)-dependent dehydrogenase (short-subunit alcohol dehydrogenase family)